MATDPVQDDDGMPVEIDFTNAVRGKFYRPNLVLRLLGSKADLIEVKHDNLKTPKKRPIGFISHDDNLPTKSKAAKAAKGKN